MAIRKGVFLGVALAAAVSGGVLGGFIARPGSWGVRSLIAGTHLVTLTLEDKRIVRLLNTVTDDGAFVTSASTGFGVSTTDKDLGPATPGPQPCANGVTSPFASLHGTGHGTWTREGIDGVWMALYLLYDGCGNFAGYMRAGGRGPLLVFVHSGPTYIDIFGPDDDPIAGVPRKHLTATFVAQRVPSSPVLPEE